MFTAGKAAAFGLISWIIAAAWGADLSQNRYWMRGELSWAYKTNTQNYPIEVFRDGEVSKILQVKESSATNYWSGGFLATPKMAVTFSQWGRDTKGSDRPKNSSNNGQVSISVFRMPEDGQLAPMWLMTTAAEQLRETNSLRPTIYTEGFLNVLHEHRKTLPICAIDKRWPTGFSRYSEKLASGENEEPYKSEFAITAWTNCNGITFPKQCSATIGDGIVRFELTITSIEGLPAPIDTHVPYLSNITDWRPMELNRLTNGCYYFITNGIVFDDVVESARQRLVTFGPALDWSQSHPIGIGTIAPDFHATDLAGKKISLSELRGKFVLLNFWSTTCGPCIGEIPDLQEVYQAFEHDNRVAIIGLALDESEKKVKAFVRNHKMPWRHIALREEFDDPIVRAYQVHGIPSSFIVGPDGKIIDYGFGLKHAIEEASHKN